MSPLGDLDEQILETWRYIADGQQVWEALATLVAMRLWKQHWHNNRVLLTVGTDNVTALTLIRKLRVKGKALGVISRELALDIASSTFEPDVCEHTPGVQNILADGLSRMFEPNAVYTLPPEFANVQRCYPPTRDAGWYRSLGSP